MKRKLFIAVCAAMAVLLASCSQMPTEANSSQTATSAATSSQESSEDTASQASSIPVSSAPASSEAVSSAPTSSQAASSAPQASSKPAESKPQASNKPVESSPQVSSKPPAQVSSDPPTSSKTETPPVKQTNPPASSAAIPDDERPMTDAEVDALIQEGISYAESLGMTWKDDYSINSSGYDPPAYSDLGYKTCNGTLLFNIDELYQLNLNSNFYYEGASIFYKIAKGKIMDDPGWYIYVLY